MAGHRIGEVAEIVGVDTHVLRHWEDVGVLVPGRTTSGQRVYDGEATVRALIIRRCQRAGLSLAQIRALAPLDNDERLELIADQRARIASAVERQRQMDAYLEHLTQCRHPLAQECSECSAFASGDVAVRAIG